MSKKQSVVLLIFCSFITAPLFLNAQTTGSYGSNQYGGITGIQVPGTTLNFGDLIKIPFQFPFSFAGGSALFGSIGKSSSSGSKSGNLIDFGGKVTATETCDSGLLLTVQEPMKGARQYMWTYGNLKYLMHVPPHPGQYLLGKASQSMVPCVVGIETIGEGYPILFHGEGN